MTNYAPRRTSYDTGDRRWLPDLLKAETHGVVIDGSLFPAGTVKSGTHVGRVATGAKLHGAYSNALSDGRQTSVGLLLDDLVVEAGKKYHVSVVHAGTVRTQFLPTGSGHDAPAAADLTAVVFI